MTGPSLRNRKLGLFWGRWGEEEGEARGGLEGGGGGWGLFSTLVIILMTTAPVVVSVLKS